MSDNLKKLASEVVSRLEDIYPDAPCALEYNGEPWKLLVMARLSAQCTDARVNIVCRELFKKYPTPEALAAGELSDIEKIVYPCGLYRVKSAEIKEECRILT
ncbi:MAG: endonuclease III, partial [Clostridia bacterium]|nr:endonuclease III [Clostridia bacterium]